MKALQKGNGKDEVWLRYVKTERDVMAYTDHPFICKLWYAFQTRSKLFLVMDFCPGGDLETLMAAEKQPFSENRAKFYTAEILLALKDLHGRNIIYRDLKPDNVVIDDAGHAEHELVAVTRQQRHCATKLSSLRRAATRTAR